MNPKFKLVVFVIGLNLAVSHSFAIQPDSVRIRKMAQVLRENLPENQANNYFKLLRKVVGPKGHLKAENRLKLESFINDLDVENQKKILGAVLDGFGPTLKHQELLWKDALKSLDSGKVEESPERIAMERTMDRSAPNGGTWAEYDNKFFGRYRGEEASEFDENKPLDAAGILKILSRVESAVDRLNQIVTL